MPIFRSVRRPIIQIMGMLTAGVLFGLLPAFARAQNAARPGPWTIELYGGASSASGSSSGTPIATFPAGTPFTLASGQPSRAVSSWYFGDGAALLNQVLAQFAAGSGTTFARLAPLDAALRAGGGSQQSGGAFGLRVGRALTPKLTVEFNVERGMAGLGLSDAMKTALRDGSDSFKDAFQGLLNTAPVTNLAVSSTLTMSDKPTQQTRLAGAVKWTVLSRSRIEAYVTGGGGLIRNSGENPQAILNGRYTFRLFGTFIMDETDRVVVTVTQPKSSVMGLVGGGVTYDLSSSAGLRVDVRLLMNSTKEVTTLTAAPNVTAASPSQVLPTSAGISPGIQFSTQTGVRSTLSGANQSLTLFTSSGLNKQIAFTLGIFKRF